MTCGNEAPTGVRGSSKTSSHLLQLLYICTKWVSWNTSYDVKEGINESLLKVAQAAL